MSIFKCEYAEIKENPVSNVVMSSVMAYLASEASVWSFKLASLSEAVKPVKTVCLVMCFVSAGVTLFSGGYALPKAIIFLKRDWAIQKKMNAGATEHLLVHVGDLTPVRMFIPPRTIDLRL